MAAKSDYKKMSRLLNETAVDLQGAELSFKVHYWGAMPEHFDNPLHRHSFFEVCYVLAGEGSYLESDEEYPLRQGTLFCSRPGKWHQIKSEAGIEIYYVAFELDSSRSSEEKLNRYLQMMNLNKIVVPMADETVTAQTWRMLFTLCKQDRIMTKEMIRSFAYALLVSFYSEFAEVVESDDFPEHQQISSYYLQRAKLFIEDNLASSLSLHQLSSYLHITERHLSRLFAVKVGQTFSHYVQERRVRKSMELLLETDWTISRIAQEIGFESVHYYSRVFTRKIGVPPGKFRKSQLSEIPFIKL
ncbi:helix-turn-helix domain-containing protein [Paenibacillus sp. LMG 31460]|uniref:Helix-turn-helix domain-containing protein n=1 Tax=Paenibacillus germinis TaxID=2654979 RepID=A0ABX1Z669_9BACL|nr:AraC family transcriptional regulator [Paenibacillus germinis]NOU88743.1 helix-turn-helix domain-containing protein [Paenibacillus germinis]